MWFYFLTHWDDSKLECRTLPSGRQINSGFLGCFASNRDCIQYAWSISSGVQSSRLCSWRAILLKVCLIPNMYKVWYCLKKPSSVSLVCLGPYVPTLSRKCEGLWFLVRLLFLLCKLSYDLELAKATLPEKQMQPFTSKCIFFLWPLWICRVQSTFFKHA